MKPTKIEKLDLKGLTTSQAKLKLAEFGPNVLEKNSKNSPLWLFLSKFFTPISLVLLGSAFFAGIFGQVRDAVVIFAMVLLSSILDFTQEYRSSKAAEKLSKRLHRKCTVIRDGIKQEISVSQVVPTDLLFISTGDIISVDGIVLESDSLLVDESALTGESFPIEKVLNNEVFTGTTVVSGSGYIQAVQTGGNTKFGQISKNLESKPLNNAYEKGVKDFSNLVFKAILLITVSVFLINVSKPWWMPSSPAIGIFELILFSITIAVGLTPELLPVVMSINMTRGALKMSKKGVLVKKLDSIPDFGSMDILCTDKTGTLTQNKITLMKHIGLDGLESERVFSLSYLNSYFQTGLKNPLDEAILVHDKADIGDYEKLAEIPYDFNRRRLSIIVHQKSDGRQLITKGQVESVLEVCKTLEVSGKVIKLDQAQTKRVLALYKKLSSDGFRVIALATSEVKKAGKYDTEFEKNLCLIGLLAFLDPPKLTAKLAVSRIENAGVKIKILTGDNELVTQKVCQELDIQIAGLIIGSSFATLSEPEKSLAVEQNNIFARFNPEQKLEAINLLKANKHVVGYMGDGINDAASLKSADVGISVENAVDVARESASIILLTKDFDSLLEGIIEGRTTFANTLKYMMMALSSNFGNMLSLVGAAIFLPFLPILPIQILLNNSLYDISQIMIPTDRVDPEQTAKPQQWDTRFVRNFMYIFGPLSSVFDLLAFYLMYSVLGLKDSVFQTAWFLTSLFSQILVIYILRTKKIPFMESCPSKWLVANSLVVLSIAVFIVFSRLGQDFGFSTLSVQVVGMSAIIIVSYLVCIQIAKNWFYGSKFS
ncbi:MAG: magnesium-translocating P-type ATPase [bacterium]